MNKKILFIAVLVLVCLVQAGLVAAEDLASKLQKIDTIYVDIDNPKRLVTMETLINQVMAESPNNYQVIWRAARYYDALGQTQDKPLETFLKGRELAEKAIQLAPNQVEGHFWLALLIGKVGQEKGIFNSLGSIKPMKEELEKCIQLNPKFPDSYHILGMLYVQAPGWPISIGDKDKAIEYNLKAVKLQSGNFAFQWGLYMAYNAAGKKAEAKEILQHIVKMPVEPEFERFAAQYKKMAEDELKKLTK